MTARQVSRHGRERRLRTLVIGGVAAALLLAVLIPGVGYYREVLTKGSQPLVTVAGQPIELDEFAKLYAYRTALLEKQLGTLQQLAATQPPGKENPFAKQLQTLQQQYSGLDNQLVDEMVDQRLVAQEAARRNIQVTRDEEDAFIARSYGDPPQPTPAASSTAQASPIPTVDAFARLQTDLTNARLMNEDDFRALVARPALLNEKLHADFAGSVPATEPAIHARHILVDTEEAAVAAKVELDRGVPFEEVARRVSKDASNKEKGGDLGWFGRGRMVPQFEEKAFSMTPGEISEPIRTGFGWHIIQVLEKDDNHPVDAARRNELADQAFRGWLENARNEAIKDNTIVYSVSPDKFAWAHNQVAKARGLPRGSG